MITGNTTQHFSVTYISTQTYFYVLTQALTQQLLSKHLFCRKIATGVGGAAFS